MHAALLDRLSVGGSKGKSTDGVSKGAREALIPRRDCNVRALYDLHTRISAERVLKYRLLLRDFIECIVPWQDSRTEDAGYGTPAPRVLREVEELVVTPGATARHRRLPARTRGTTTRSTGGPAAARHHPIAALLSSFPSWTSCGRSIATTSATSSIEGRTAQPASRVAATCANSYLRAVSRSREHEWLCAARALRRTRVKVSSLG